MAENYKIKLHVLTPTHIGSGEAYDPTQFVIDDTGVMHVFKTSDFLVSLNEKQAAEFTDLCKSLRNNLVPVFRFFKTHFNNSVSHRSIKTSPDLFRRYQEILGSGSTSTDVINQFELKRTIFNENLNQAYIPGSSLKGCLKTLWMSAVAVQENFVARPSNNNFEHRSALSELEQKILCGSFSSDPFRFMKVSDLYAKDSSPVTEIQYAVNRSKKPEKSFNDRLSVPLEVIATGAKFEGILNLGQPDIYPEGIMRRKVHFDALMKSAKLYYLPKIKLLQTVLDNVSGSSRFITEMSKFKDKLFKTAIPVRLGHHSSAEFLTFDNSRKIKISPPGKPPRYSDEATTVWLSSASKKPSDARGLQPFGWSVLEFEKL